MGLAPDILLPASRVRALLRLAREMNEIAKANVDPVPHVAEGLRLLVGADAGGIVMGNGMGNGAPRFSLTRMVHAGLPADTAREIEALYLSQHGCSVDPAARAIVALGAVAALRRQLVTDRAWYGSPFVNEHRRRWRLDDSIYGVFPNAAGVGGIGYLRAWGARPFDETDCVLIEMFFQECGRLVLLAHHDGRRFQGAASLRTMRAQLFASPTSTLAEVSQTLGMSNRSLQRQLTSAGSSFRAEVSRARLEAAKNLLAESDLKLAAIALEVGCASSQHFSAQFRRLTGSTPSAWRARARGNSSWQRLPAE